MSIFHTALLAPLETLINAALAADPASRQRLAGMGPGRVLQVHCESPISADVYIRTTESGLLLQGNHTGGVDCRLAGPAGALLRLMVADDPRRALYDPALTLNGDTGLANGLQHLIRDLDIDWEDRLAPLLGNVATHQLGEWLRGAKRQADYSADRLEAMLRDYLQEESGMLVDRIEYEAFRNELDALRLRMDRLQARVRELHNTATK